MSPSMRLPISRYCAGRVERLTKWCASRLPAGTEPHQVDAELGQAAGISQAPFRAIPHPRLEGFGIARAADNGHGLRVECRKFHGDTSSIWAAFIAATRSCSVS